MIAHKRDQIARALKAGHAIMVSRDQKTVIHFLAGIGEGDVVKPLGQIE